MSNIFINSKHRTTGNFNDFVVSVNNNFSFFNLKNDEKLMVYPSRLSILNDYYNINTYNNKFNLKVFDINDNLTNTILIEIDEGYYDVFNFAEILESEVELQLNNNISLGDFSVSVVFDTSFSKYTINILNADFYNAGNTLRLEFENINTTLAQFIGYDAGEYEGVNISNGEKFVSIKPVNFLFQSEIHVYCSLVRNNLETTENGINNSNLLFTFAQNAPKNEYLIFQNPEKLYLTDCLNKFSNIEISFRDSLDRPILFKSDCQIVLSFIKVQHKTTDEQILQSLENLNRLKELSILGQQLQLSKNNEKD